MFVQMVLKWHLNGIIQQFANIFHIFPILLGKNQQSIPILVYIIRHYPTIQSRFINVFSHKKTHF